MKESREKLLKAIYIQLDPWGKAGLENEYPELFNPQLTPNTWYDFLDGDIFFVKDSGLGTVSGYGMVQGEWINNSLFYAYEKAIPATNEQIEAMLVKEALNRGFEGNVKFDSIVDPLQREVNMDDSYYMRYCERDNDLECFNGVWSHTVMRDGKWAEPEPLIEEYTPQIGDWVYVRRDYITTSSGVNEDALIYFNGYNKLNYGLNHAANWTDCYRAIDEGYSRGVSYRKATMEEVEYMLKAQADLRGFVRGARFTSPERVLLDMEILEPMKTKCTGRINMVMYPSETALLNSGYEAIYTNGKWAEISETITKAEAEAELGKVIV